MYTIIQHLGPYCGEARRYEYIIDAAGRLTHQRWGMKRHLLRKRGAHSIDISTEGSGVDLMNRPPKLDALPPGCSPVTFPSGWCREGSEGLVVEFDTDDVGAWVGIFRPGIQGSDGVWLHPNGKDALVIAQGAPWIVDPEARAATKLNAGVEEVWPVSDPEGLLLSRDGLAFYRIASGGLMWHTRRLSWDGFQKIEIRGQILHGEGWSPVDDRWFPFSVDLRSGRSEGGSYTGPDPAEWEHLAV